MVSTKPPQNYHPPWPFNSIPIYTFISHFPSPSSPQCSFFRASAIDGLLWKFVLLNINKYLRAHKLTLKLRATVSKTRRRRCIPSSAAGNQTNKGTERGGPQPLPLVLLYLFAIPVALQDFAFSPWHILPLTLFFGIATFRFVNLSVMMLMRQC